MKKQYLLFLFCFAAFLKNTSGQTGILWGTTIANASYNVSATVFGYDALANNESIDITTPSSALDNGLIQATDGYIYGMCSGGSVDNGVIFRCSIKGTISTIYSFNKTTGYCPYGSLLQASDSYLYGTACFGGTFKKGIIFKFSTAGNFTVLANFDSANGAYPSGSLIQYNGSFYGMTQEGGTYQKGNIFKCSTAGVITSLFSFNGTNGDDPKADLLLAKDGFFYGMTYAGGKYNIGVIFKCDTLGNLDTLFSFSKTTGANPYANLMQASDGNFYGTAYSYGPNGYGTMFKFTPGGVFSILYSFGESYYINGINPESTLMQASDGNIYGTTILGGVGEWGNIIKYTIGGSEAVAWSFNKTDGWNPGYGKLLEVFSLNMALTDSSCTYQNLKINMRGAALPYKIKWSTGDTVAEIKNITAAGSYSVTVTDARGIVLSDSIKLSTYTHVMVHDTGTNVTCYGDSNGSITPTASGGVGSYIFDFKPFAGGVSTYYNLAPITYITYVTDNSGCKDSTTYTISQPLRIKNGLKKYDTVCIGDTVYYNNQKYYGAGTYYDTIKGKHTCYILDTISVTQYAKPVLNISGHDTIMQGARDTLIVTGANGYYWWVNGSSSDTLIVNPLKDSTFYVDGYRYCSVTDSITIYVKLITAALLSNTTVSFGIYPNPVINSLRVMRTNGSNNGIVEIRDITGRKILNEKMPIGNLNTLVDVSSLAYGVYTLRLICDKQIYITKFVKE